LVDAGVVRRFDGDLDDYREWVLSGRAREVAVASPAGAAGPDRRAQRRAEAQARQHASDLRKPVADKLARAETRLDELTREKRELDTWLASPDAYLEENKQRLKDALSRHADLGWELARVETQWLELQEALVRLRTQ